MNRKNVELSASPSIGIFGGTFDPIHFGHMNVARDVTKELFLHHMFVIPTWMQPFKQEQNTVSGFHRLEMVKLAFQNDPKIHASALDIERNKITYTIDTLNEFEQIIPGANLFFVLGADAFLRFPEWRNNEEIREKATIVCVSRHGLDLIRQDERDIMLEVNMLDISSTAVREHVRNDDDISEFVPESVSEYITKHRLYKD